MNEMETGGRARDGRRKSRHVVRGKPGWRLGADEMAHRRAGGNPSEEPATVWEEVGRKTEAGWQKPTLEALFSSESTQISLPKPHLPEIRPLIRHFVDINRRYVRSCARVILSVFLTWGNFDDRLPYLFPCANFTPISPFFVRGSFFSGKRLWLPRTTAAKCFPRPPAKRDGTPARPDRATELLPLQHLAFYDALRVLA